MQREKITRNDLKKNFLKKIIMRLDFQGVLQAEMESIILKVKPFLKGKGFNRYEEKAVNQISSNESSLPDIKSQMVFSFTAESLGYTLEMSNTSIIMTIMSNTYSPFDQYSAIFCHIATIYNETIDFFTAKRFGLRKINFCFIKDKNKINQYFVPAYYNCDIPVSGFESKIMEQKNNLSDGLKNLNLRYAIEEGLIDVERYYKVTLDADIYLTSQDEIMKTVFNEQEIGAINEKLFSVYINAITEEFLNVLASDREMTTNEILGVELND